ncbi:Hypothetical protein NTJ_07761 [Nesidiocoris tenuis]|uniref:COX assembly mitochondrial protein n=1 Tax=Nesidiocoris tenuis TaxID=355587 RepID=A0ABN7AUA6_9HEMI|nr:Hypothetical protein NTJ_07761 [Nesidiocoris tenuis]
MHVDLAPHLHSDECNELIKQLKDCHVTHDVAKFWGACNDIERLMTRCLRREREGRRQRNAERGILQREKLKSRSAKEETA